jgi:hypothetical protein
MFYEDKLRCGRISHMIDDAGMPANAVANRFGQHCIVFDQENVQSGIPRTRWGEPLCRIHFSELLRVRLTSKPGDW